MKQLKIWRSLVLALSAIGIAGCTTDLSTAPKFHGDPSTGLVTDLVKKNVLERKTPLSEDITVTATIDEKGGSLSIPAAGFHLTVPQGAVKSKTKFTVTAIKGSLVAYEFGPHGIRFAKS